MEFVPDYCVSFLMKYNTSLYLILVPSGSSMAVNLHIVLIITFSFVPEYRVWVLEPRVQQQYTAYLSIVNRNFSSDLASHSSPSFKRETKALQKTVRTVRIYLIPVLPDLMYFIL